MRSSFLLLVLFLAMPFERSVDPSFEEVSGASGLFPSLAGMMGHAAAWGDVDRNGLPDLFVAGFCDRPAAEYAPAGGPVGAKLFRNLGSGKFERIRNPEVEFCGRSSGAIFADLNNDRFPELLVANDTVRENPKNTGEMQNKAQSLLSKLFRNEKGKFTDISAESGAGQKDGFGVRSVATLDFNGDGLLDVFLLQDKFRKGKMGPSSILLKNTGNLKFQDVTREAGLPNDIHGLGVAIADLNDDSRPDFFISHSNRLFLSTGGNQYKESTEGKEVFRWDPLDSEDWPCGVAFGDLNRDGMLDLVITAHHAPARNRVYINRGLKNGIPVFENVTAAIGLGENIPVKSPHVEIQDFNNDGMMDIYISAAWKESGKIVPLIYASEGLQKNGLPRFRTARAIKSPMIYFPSGPTSDFNMDGKMDILLVNWFSGETSHLLANRTKGGNWLQVKGPIGSKVKITSGGKLIGYQQIYIGNGYASGQSPVCHFGVGSLKTVDVEIAPPRGPAKKQNNIAVNRVLEF